ncbi:hypothetical protein [Usitatibacter palustris]|nr:hypothetical protein [Usitatibacter palustris]
MSRTARRFAALLATVTLVFSQLAVSAFACAKEGPAALVAPPMAQSHGADCPDRPSRNICHEHCSYGTTSVDTNALALPAPDLALLPWRLTLPEVRTHSAAVREWRMDRATGPPPPLLFGALRI